VALEEVLLVGDGEKVTVGTPKVSGAKVAATVLEQMRDDKVIVFKKKRRHNYRRKKGHRQFLTVLQITEIAAGGKSVKADKLIAPSKQAPALLKADRVAAKAAPAADAKPAKKAAAPKAAAAKAPAKAPAKKAAAKKAE
jgi:large subunit ribosomal protein L21